MRRKGKGTKEKIMGKLSCLYFNTSNLNSAFQYRGYTGKMKKKKWRGLHSYVKFRVYKLLGVGWVWIVGQSCGLLIWNSVLHTGGIPQNLSKWRLNVWCFTCLMANTTVKLPFCVISSIEWLKKKGTVAPSHSEVNEELEEEGGCWDTAVCPKPSPWVTKWGLKYMSPRLLLLPLLDISLLF